MWASFRAYKNALSATIVSAYPSSNVIVSMAESLKAVAIIVVIDLC